MAYVLLPQLPKAAKLTMRMLRFGNDLTPALGGPTQRIQRLGARFSVEVSLPPLGEACARAWLAARLQAEAEGLTVRLIMPQLGDASSLTDVTAVSGGGASLTVNEAAGVEPGHSFSFVHGGRAYFHQVTAVAGDTLRVAPLLRVDPAGLALKFDAPRLEGFMDDVSWDLDRLRFVGQSFTVTEDR